MSGRLWALLFLFCTPLLVAQDAIPPSTAPGQLDGGGQPGLLNRPPEAPESRDASGKTAGRLSLDISVTDPAGKPVSGLSEGDFTVLDNHQAAKLLSFQAVDGTVTSSGPAQVILLVDAVNSAPENVAVQRDQIVKYLERNGGQLPFPTSIALFSDSGVKIDQPTLDGNLLIAELKKMPVTIRTIDSAMGSEGDVQRFQLSLKTLTQLLTYEAPKPGRKLVIWIGPGWPTLAEAHFGPSERDRHLYWDSIVSFSRDLRDARHPLQHQFAGFRRKPLSRRFLSRFPEAGDEAE